MSIQNPHPYDKNPAVYNFFFHPLHGKDEVNTAFSVITNIFITLFTGGLWQIPFWIVNQIDQKKMTIWKEKTKKIDEISGTVFSHPSDKAERPFSEEKRNCLTPDLLESNISDPKDLSGTLSPLSDEVNVFLLSEKSPVEDGAESSISPSVHPDPETLQEQTSVERSVAGETKKPSLLSVHDKWQYLISGSPKSHAALQEFASGSAHLTDEIKGLFLLGKKCTEAGIVVSLTSDGRRKATVLANADLAKACKISEDIGKEIGKSAIEDLEIKNGEINEERMQLFASCFPNLYRLSISHSSVTTIPLSWQQSLTELNCHWCLKLKRLSLPRAKKLECTSCYGIQKISAPIAETLRCDLVLGLESLSAPLAKTIDCSGCNHLKTLSLPEAKTIDCSWCKGLQSLSAPKAKKINCTGCRLLTNLNAPSAKVLKIGNCDNLNTLTAERAEDVDCLYSQNLKSVLVKEGAVLYGLQPGCKVTYKEGIPSSEEEFLKKKAEALSLTSSEIWQYLVFGSNDSSIQESALSSDGVKDLFLLGKKCQDAGVELLITESGKRKVRLLEKVKWVKACKILKQINTHLKSEGVRDLEIKERLVIQDEINLLASACPVLDSLVIHESKIKEVPASWQESLRELHCKGCKELQFLSLPKIITLNCSGCIQLETLSSPNVKSLDCTMCKKLQQISAPMAMTLDCAWCLSLKSIFAPMAKTLYCQVCPELERVSAEEATELLCTSSKKLKSVLVKKGCPMIGLHSECKLTYKEEPVITEKMKKMFLSGNSISFDNIELSLSPFGYCRAILLENAHVENACKTVEKIKKELAATPIADLLIKKKGVTDEEITLLASTFPLLEKLFIEEADITAIPEKWQESLINLRCSKCPKLQHLSLMKATMLDCMRCDSLESVTVKKGCVIKGISSDCKVIAKEDEAEPGVVA